MSENAVIQETAYEAPAASPFDTSQESFDQADKEQSLESAMDDNIQAKELGDSETVEAEEANEEVQESEDDKFNAKFAALSKREKQLREKESQMQDQYTTKLSELEAKIEALSNPQTTEVEEVQEAKELPLEYRLKRDPLGTLKELGLSYDELTNLALNEGKLSPEMQMQLMKEEMQAEYNSKFEKLQNDQLDRQKEREEEKYNNTVANFKSEITDFVNDGDTYELIRANDAVDVVYEVIEEHYKDTGRIMEKQEAADQVESYLEGEMEKLFQLKKAKSRFPVQEVQKAQEAQKPESLQKSPTLSNAHSTAASKPRRPLTRDESIAQIASQLKWND